MISNGEVISGVHKTNDFIMVMLGKFLLEHLPYDYNFGHSPYPALPLWDPAEMCEVCECFLGEDESGLCVDCESMGPDYGDEPDVDEAQEWHDFDPDC